MRNLLLAACLVVVGALAVAYYRVRGLGVRVEQMQAQVVAMEDEHMTVTTSWQSGASTVTVTTKREDGETAETWKARHAKQVAEAQAAFPPNGP